MTNSVLVAPNDTLPHSFEEAPFVVSKKTMPNKALSKNKKAPIVSDLNIAATESQIEEALINAEIFYCKAHQLIEKFKTNPSFIIPKYKILIFVEDSSNLRIEPINTKWKVFRFCIANAQLSESIKSCLDYIKAQKTERNHNHTFTFIDLFAGIGGFRIPLESLGGKCLGFSEIDKKAIETYQNNFIDDANPDEMALGSVVNLGKLPFENIDLIVGGVPCQSWSVAGKMRGFDDPRGKLWEDTIRIVELNQPKAFIFENVKGLIDPRNRESLSLIIESFETIGYTVAYKLLNSYDFGLPQGRERIYIVGIRNDQASRSKYRFPVNQNKKSYLYEIIEGLEDFEISPLKEKFEPKDLFGEKIPMSRNRFQKVNELNDFFVFCDTRNGHTTIHSWDMIATTDHEKEVCMTILRNRRKQKYGKADGNPLSFENLKALLPNLDKKVLDGLIEKKILKFLDEKGYVFVNSKNSSGINGLYRIYLPNSNIFPTITATGTKDVVALANVEGKTSEEFKNNFVEQIIKTQQYRPITARESGKLQGFPDNFVFNKDEKYAKKQFGNAVSTSVVYHVAKVLIDLEILNNITWKQ